MIQIRTPQQIVSDGLDQFIMHAPAATGSISILRGALAYCQAGEGVHRKRPSVAWVETIPSEPAAVVQDE